MQLKSKPNPRFVETNDENGKVISVIIAYDDLRSGQRAGQLFSWVAQEQEDLQFRLQPWRFDFLEDAEWSRFAAAEARHADLLVLAMMHSSLLPAAVEQWLSGWLERKRGAHAALVVLVESKNEALDGDSSKLQFLQDAAEQAGLDFFTPVASGEDIEDNVMAAPLQAFTYSKPYRHGGLNE